MIETIKNNMEKIKKAFSIIFFVIFTVFILIEISKIDFRSYNEALNNFSFFQKLLFIILGLLAFSFTTLYDFIMVKFFNLDLQNKTVFKTAFITNSFNNFISFGGLTSLKLRYDLYSKENVDNSTSFKIGTSVMASTLLGLFTFIVFSIFSLRSVANISPKLYLLCLFFLYIPFYFFFNKIPKGKLKAFVDEHFPYSFLSNKVKLKLYLVSLMDWFMVSSFFAFIIKNIDNSIPFKIIIFSYIISNFIGIISLIPGGLLSFDLSILYFLSSFGYRKDQVLLAVIIFRICYYLIPWIIGAFLIVREKLKDKKDKLNKSREIVSNILSYLVFFAGVIILVKAATPSIIERSKFINKIIPKDIVEYSKIFLFAIGIFLIILSRGIKNRVKKVYKITFSLLILGIIALLVKGLNFEDAFILIILLFILYYTKDVYTKESEKISKKDMIFLGMLFFVINILFFIVYNVTHKVNIYTSKRPFSLYFLEHNKLKVLIFYILVASIIVVFFYQKRKYLKVRELTKEDILKYEEFMNNHEGNYYTHLFYMMDKNLFFNSKNTVMMMYSTYNDNIVVLGDPVGEKEDIEDAIDELIDFASKYDMKVSFYEVLGENLENYANEGFSFIKIGEDSYIDLNTFTYEGKKNKNLRKAHNRLSEYEFQVLEPPFTTEILETLEKISNSWLGKKKELSFSLGNFSKEYLEKAKIFLLKDKSGKIIAFASEQIVRNTKKVSIDLMRYSREDCVNDEMNILFLFVIDYYKSLNYEEFYLGMAPLSKVGNKKYSNNKEKIMRLCYEYLDNFYSFKGLRLFKEKFHPHWKSRFIVYRNDTDLLDVLFGIYSIIHKTKGKKEA